MLLIIGLGNPGKEYECTRHNIGFLALDKLSSICNIPTSQKKFNGLYGTGLIGNEKVILLKPQTFMNNSGLCIAEFKTFYKIDIENIIVVYDDIDLPVGNIRIRKSGGPGTHNGMKSIVDCLHSDKFNRIRIGTGAPEFKNDLVNYVLSNIPPDDFKIFENTFSVCADATVEIIKNGINIAMNKFNGK